MEIKLGDQSTWQNEGLEWMRYDYPLTPGDKVLDIGSYRGEFAQGIKDKYGCQVECFDALDNKAAWVFDGEIEMGGQYYYTSAYDKGELGPVNKYKCVDIATYLQSEVSLVKINIEGMEYGLLGYIIQNGLHLKIKHLQVQFHLIDGIDCEAAYNQINKHLSLSHDCKWRYPYVWESWTRIF